MGRGWAWAALAVWLAAGCDGDFVPPEAGVVAMDAGAEVAPAVLEAGVADAPATDLPAGDPVIGLWRGIFVTRHGEERLGFDLRDLPFTVFAETPEGQFTQHAGGGDIEGGFVVAGVPAVPHWLHFHDLFLANVPGQPPFDILEPVLGRSSSEPAPVGTILELQVAGLAPLQRGDLVYLYAPDSGTSLFDVAFAGPRPPAGTTNLDVVIDVSEISDGNLIEGTVSGDVAHVVQLVHAPAPLWPNLRVARGSMRTSELQMAAGETSRWAGTLQESDPVESATITFQGAQLAELAGPQPGMTMVDQWIDLVTLPGAARHGAYDSAAALFQTRSVKAGSVPETPAVFEWRNPFPDHWGRVLRHQTTFRVALPVPAAPPWFVIGSLGGRQMVEPGQTVTVAPSLGPPGDIRIDGRDPGGDVTGVGLHPVISWSPPALGAPNGYAVEIHVRREREGLPDPRYKGTLVVSGTSARVPPGLLEPDTWAVAVVRAVANPHYGPRNPHRPAPQMAWADAVSPAFRP